MVEHYIPVPVEAAAQIGKQYGKNIVVINAWDAAHGVLHTTTWGDAGLDKHHAAIAGELCAKALRADFDDKTVFEDYRLRISMQLYEALALMVFEYGDSGPLHDRVRGALVDAEITLGLKHPIGGKEAP